MAKPRVKSGGDDGIRTHDLRNASSINPVSRGYVGSRTLRFTRESEEFEEWLSRGVMHNFTGSSKVHAKFSQRGPVV